MGMLNLVKSLFSSKPSASPPPSPLVGKATVNHYVLSEADKTILQDTINRSKTKALIPVDLTLTPTTGVVLDPISKAYWIKELQRVSMFVQFTMLSDFAANSIIFNITNLSEQPTEKSYIDGMLGNNYIGSEIPVFYFNDSDKTIRILTDWINVGAQPPYNITISGTWTLKTPGGVSGGGGGGGGGGSVTVPPHDNLTGISTGAITGEVTINDGKQYHLTNSGVSVLNATVSDASASKTVTDKITIGTITGETGGDDGKDYVLKDIGIARLNKNIADVGDTTTLATTVKTDLVSAVNEVNGKISVIDILDSTETDTGKKLFGKPIYTYAKAITFGNIIPSLRNLNIDVLINVSGYIVSAQNNEKILFLNAFDEADRKNSVAYIGTMLKFAYNGTDANLLGQPAVVIVEYTKN